MGSYYRLVLATPVLSDTEELYPSRRSEKVLLQAEGLRALRSAAPESCCRGDPDVQAGLGVFFCSLTFSVSLTFLNTVSTESHNYL